jgi:hypothetical protein
MNEERRRFGSQVDILLPGRVDGDLESIERVTRDVLGRLGCPGCHSGFDLRFRILEETMKQPAFKVDQELNVEEVKFG